MKIKWVFCGVIFILSGAISFAQQTKDRIFSVKDFGAAGNGKTDDAVAIQNTIDACSKAGGGTVLFTAPDTYLTGPFTLKSNIDFHIEGGATILANPNEKVYTKSAFRFKSRRRHYLDWCRKY
jgi:polygalacturonase